LFPGPTCAESLSVAEKLVIADGVVERAGLAGRMWMHSPVELSWESWNAPVPVKAAAKQYQPAVAGWKDAE
jgi:hypothetical protein